VLLSVVERHFVTGLRRAATAPGMSSAILLAAVRLSCGLTLQNRFLDISGTKMVQCGIAFLYCVLEFSMDDIVDRVMNCYGIEPVRNIQSRDEVKAKLGNYLATLSSAGQRNADQLIEYGVAYLRGLHEGPDSRYTGC
jgi:hypothetical protein